MMRALILATALLCLVPALAFGQQACGPRDRTLDGLAREHGERPAARMLNERGRILEFMASPEGSWSMLVTCPGMQQGTVCWGGSGIGFELIAPPPALPGKGA